ncbi:MAG: hypothetical protein MJ101_01490 [Clostridia bacterium]|nr:hypothetical protein [Clostridia bacterium]
MKTNRTSYFAAAPTSDGFDSNFGEIFAPEKFDTLYVLKGGPGCGKSTLMKRIASEAQRRNTDHIVYYCSADTSSLDGVILPQLATAVVDGTAPHTVDAAYPGAVEIIVDLGACFDRKRLSEVRDRIITASNEYSAVRRRADRWMRSAGNAYSACLISAEAIFDRAKSLRVAERIAAQFSREKSPCFRRAYTSVLSAGGRCDLDTFFVAAESVTDVGDELCAGRLFMRDVVSALRTGGVSHTVCPSVLAPTTCESVYIPSARHLIRLHDKTENEKFINPRRFIRDRDAEKRLAVRSGIRMTEKICDCAVGEMMRALAKHNELETLYAPCVDFGAVEKIANDLILSIFG